CCFNQKAESGSHHHGDSASLSNHHSMGHMDMSEMDMNMSGSDMETNETETPLPMLKRDLPQNVPSDTHGTTDAIREERGPCSHCEMHSRSVTTFPVSVSGQANVSHHITAPDVATATLKRVPLLPAVFELHEHGPPGSSASPVYILINAFRI